MPTHPDDNDLDESGFDDTDSLTAADIAIFVDEHGVEHAFGVLAVVEAAGGEYALATPLEHLEEAEEDPESLELFVFRYTVDAEGAEHYEPVDDETIFAAVTAAAQHLIGFEQERPPVPYVGPVGEA